MEEWSQMQTKLNEVLMKQQSAKDNLTNKYRYRIQPLMNYSVSPKKSVACNTQKYKIFTTSPEYISSHTHTHTVVLTVVLDVHLCEVPGLFPLLCSVSKLS